MSTSMREVLEQIAAVCADNAPGHCDKALALKFVADVASAALSSPAPDRLSEEEQKVVSRAKDYIDNRSALLKTPLLFACVGLLAIIDRLSRQPEAEPDAYAEIIGSRVVSCRPDKSPHCTAPLYLTSPCLDREKVLAALKPFADAAADYDEVPGVCLTHGDVEVWQQPNRAGYRLTVDDLRRAREVADAITRETR